MARGGGVSALSESLADYLRLRRALGYKLKETGEQLERFVEFLNARGARTITTELSLEWATAPAAATPGWWASRLTMVRGFARYLNALDPAVEVPPRGALPPRRTRATPYLYSDREIAALLRATDLIQTPLKAATYRALVGLLAATGMRVGEAISADRDDLDLATAVLLVRSGKFGKARELPLHPTTLAALEGYLRTRDQHFPGPCSSALLISTAGTRLIYKNVQFAFLHTLVSGAGLRPRSARCRPRVHDLRHSFAVRTLLEWYRSGADVQRQLPLLSTYLGHVNPTDTYWYLSAAPELLALAGERLERHLGGAP
jgi:integrase